MVMGVTASAKWPSGVSCAKISASRDIAHALQPIRSLWPSAVLLCSRLAHYLGNRSGLVAGLSEDCGCTATFSDTHWYTMDKATPLDHRKLPKQAQFPDTPGLARTYSSKLVMSRLVIGVCSNGFTVTVLQPGRYRLARGRHSRCSTEVKSCKTAKLPDTLVRGRGGTKLGRGQVEEASGSGGDWL